MYIRGGEHTRRIITRVELAQGSGEPGQEKEKEKRIAKSRRENISQQKRKGRVCEDHRPQHARKKTYIETGHKTYVRDIPT
jgi:hypothetical protein